MQNGSKQNAAARSSKQQIITSEPKTAAAEVRKCPIDHASLKSASTSSSTASALKQEQAPPRLNGATSAAPHVPRWLEIRREKYKGPVDVDEVSLGSISDTESLEPSSLPPLSLLRKSLAKPTSPSSAQKSVKKVQVEVPEEKKDDSGDKKASARPSLAKASRPSLATSRKYQSAMSLSRRELRTSIAEENANSALSELRVYQAKPLTNADKVLVMQGWNKCLAFKTAFSESLLIYWRLLCQGHNEEKSKSTMDLNAMACVEKNKDPLYKCFGNRLADAETLLIGVLDGAIRSLCPKNQVVQREAYRAMVDESILQRHRNDFSLECETMTDHFDLFARLGIEPKFWCLFVEAVIWAMKTHAPYAQTDDFDDLELAPAESAWGRVIALQVAIPAIEVKKALSTLYKAPVVGHLQTIWGRLSSSDQADFGEAFYRKLLTNHPDLLDFFSRTDMDALAVHLSMALDLVIKNVHSLGVNVGVFRASLDHLGETHRKMNIPTYSYALVGGTILECFKPVFAAEEEATKDSNDPVSAKDLLAALTKVYSEVMSIVYYPMLRQEKQVVTAREFYEQLKVELEWSESTFERRMLQIEEEIASTGSYIQTTEEVEMGARLAWRNSAKCIGRISWNTLQIRDCRHINDPKRIFEETRKHLLEATAGTNIQSIMTVFKPQSLNEPFGTRFWSSQLVRYAAYKNPLTGEITGDPANLELTDYLIDNKFWTPPDEISPFDVLPLVLKVPGKLFPVVHELPKDCIFEVDLEHPTNEKLTALGYRWTTVPAISNFKMNLGGVVYQNMPFNGWFVSTEIVRNLMERYDAGPAIAQALGIDMEKSMTWRQAATIELENMVIHSFQKNGYTIVDPMTVGQSFCTHVRREREEHGRECPGQWSWIGGLVGPTNPTWHLEMRDFLINPQYEYCAEGLVLHTSLESSGKNDEVSSHTDLTAMSEMSVVSQIPRVLIIYGSETGNAESVARSLARALRLTKPVLLALNKAKGLNIVKKKNINYIISVCSTFGKGNAPGNATEFFDTKIEEDLPEGVKFAVLALGSTIYPDFCQAGVKLDKLLDEAGLERCAQLTKADEASGAQETITCWAEMITNIVLPPGLKEYMLELAANADDKPPVHSLKWLGAEEGPVSVPSADDGALCVWNEELLQPCDKSIRKITFEAPSSYETGDHLSVMPLNSESVAERFLRCFEFELSKQLSPPAGSDLIKWALNQPFDIQAQEGEEKVAADTFFETPTTLKYILTAKLDLSLRDKDVPDFLGLLKRFVVDETLNQLKDIERIELLGEPKVQQLLKLTELQQGSKAYADNVNSFIASYPTIVDFLEDFKEILLEDYFGEVPVLKLPELLVTMGRLQPRFYSISSSSNTNPKEISLTVGVLKTKTSKDVTIEGVCSHFLARLQPGKDRALVRVNTSSFRLPEDPKAPIIMVGAGTGLSPMMGFLEDKVLDKKNGVPVGDIHLFFGCRTEKDFIYKDFLRQLEKDGLIKLHLALSRTPGTPKKYVQDKILDAGKEVSDLLAREDTHYYVCGDARMADSCYESCISLLRTHGKKSRVSSAQFLKKMRMQGRWQTDVWGIVSHFEDAKKSIMKSKREAAKLWMAHFRTED